MNDRQLMRYARHILLDEFGVEGQERLLAARVLIVGAGGLGSPAASYLAAAGVGHMVLADDDEVDLGNLQRQILHTTERLGWPKAESGRHMLQQINPEICVVPLPERLEGKAMDDAVRQADIVLDCCDNFATRHSVNRACVKHGRPLVSGAAIRFSGQVSVYDTRQPESPCYHCLFPQADGAQELRCATTGVLGPLVGIIGSMQAAEAIKLIAGMGESLVGRLLCLDALSMQWQTVRFKRDPSCAVCADRSAPTAAAPLT
ncbi:HesA/MoeB/ThiF family protein [Allopusillimonas ginsengisoli]|uniref:HesA/MoeB/ThiF family protein n=1 Tax=Allopusillimonas ginsengisoli TaxID=453575 RepID=UPI0039C35D4E